MFGLEELTWKEWMCCIAQNCQLPLYPGRQNLHVEQFPYLQAVWISFLEESKQLWIEVLVDVEKLFERSLLIPF